MVMVLEEEQAPPSGLLVAPDETAARRTLRAQVAHLERALQQVLVTAFPRAGIEVALEGGRPASPRMLDLGELEILRDRLSDQLSRARAQLHERAEREEEARRLLERMFIAPGEHRFMRVRNADLGEGGCGVYHVRPRLGIVGMLAGWWHVKLSSGCPLAGGRPAPLPAPPDRWDDAAASGRSPTGTRLRPCPPPRTRRHPRRRPPGCARRWPARAPA